MRHLIRPLLIAMALTLSACVILPIPIPPRGTEVDVKAATLVIGETTRAEVHALLGPPNGFVSDRHELWALEWDPAHMYWIILLGGPGYASGDAFRTGGVVGYSVVVGYDNAGVVRSWRWQRQADGGGATSRTGLLAPPATFANRQFWRHDVALSRGNSDLLLLDIREHGPITLTVVTEDGHEPQVSSGESGPCGRLKGFQPVYEPLPVVLVDGRLVSVPLVLQEGAQPCDWETTAAGRLVGVPRDGFTVDGDQPALSRPARLAGTLVVLRAGEADLEIRSIDGDLLATTRAGTSMPLLATDSTISARLLMRIPEDGAALRYVLFDRSTQQLVELAALAAGAQRAGCAKGGMALAPDGAEAALLCDDHLQLWSLVNPRMPELAAIVPLPAGIARGVVSYVHGGQRLAAASSGIALWRTDDWALEAYLPDTGALVVTSGSGLVLTADGKAVATSTGLWQAVEPGS
jgi:hypothetical protein